MWALIVLVNMSGNIGLASLGVSPSYGDCEQIVSLLPVDTKVTYQCVKIDTSKVLTLDSIGE
jgi:hypothetical protein